MSRDPRIAKRLAGEPCLHLRLRQGRVGDSRDLMRNELELRPNRVWSLGLRWEVKQLREHVAVHQILNAHAADLVGYLGQLSPFQEQKLRAALAASPYRQVAGMVDDRRKSRWRATGISIVRLPKLGHDALVASLAGNTVANRPIRHASEGERPPSYAGVPGGRHIPGGRTQACTTSSHRRGT
jgi:hypothetical protein